ANCASARPGTRRTAPSTRATPSTAPACLTRLAERADPARIRGALVVLFVTLVVALVLALFIEGNLRGRCAGPGSEGVLRRSGYAGEASETMAPEASGVNSEISRPLPHLLADRHDGRIRQAPALPVRAVDDERVAGD